MQNKNFFWGEKETFWQSGETEGCSSCQPRNSKALMPESTVVTAQKCIDFINFIPKTTKRLNLYQKIYSKHSST